MPGKLPSFFKETVEVMLNLWLTVYLLIYTLITDQQVHSLKKRLSTSMRRHNVDTMLF